jgi:phosphatidylserine/phosphatidylglycerophosphate/cardiolipin synthase-like enzyme
MDRLAPEPSNGRLLGILATTFEMQPEFFETDFLPTLFGLGAWDDRAWSSRIGLERQLAELETATLLMDSHPYRGRPRSLRVEVVPVSLGAGRILHAKVVICVHDETVRLIVGSANLTEPGYRRNREVVAVLEASAKRPTDAALIASAIQDTNLILAESLTASARQLLELALQRLARWKTTNLDT